MSTRFSPRSSAKARPVPLPEAYSPALRYEMGGIDAMRPSRSGIKSQSNRGCCHTIDTAVVNHHGQESGRVRQSLASSRIGKARDRDVGLFLEDLHQGRGGGCSKHLSSDLAGLKKHIISCDLHHFLFDQLHISPFKLFEMFWTIGCIYGATSVALGAFGAHTLKKRLSDPQRLASWSTAAHYQVEGPDSIISFQTPPTTDLSKSSFRLSCLSYS